MLKSVLLLLRPQQWIKQSFIFLPLFFDRHLLDWDYISPCLIGFFAFSLVASSIYCFNDIIDVESDRQHPTKRARPIASGKISIVPAYILMISLFLFSLITIIYGFNDNAEIMYKSITLVSTYYLINILYCVRLKRIAILDVFIISVGFVLRVLLGGIVTGIVVTHWIILMTFLLALFLAFAKRRDDVVLFEKNGLELRSNIKKYNLVFINQVISIVATIIIVCYIQYTVSPEVINRMDNDYIYMTTIWVLLGILRYLQLTIVNQKSGSPTKILFHDYFIQITIVGWILTFFFILYY